MNQPLYGVWLGEVFFCFSGEVSEPKVDAWSRVVKQFEWKGGVRPFANAVLRLAELRYPSSSANPKASNRRGERRQLMGRTLEGLALSPQDAFFMLLAWDDETCLARGIQPGPEMSYWVKVARFALELMLHGRISPGTAPLVTTGTRRRTGEQVVTSRWKPKLRDKHEAEIFLQLAASMPPLAFGVPAFGGFETKEEAGAAVLHSFLSAVIHTEIKDVIQGLEAKLSKYMANYRRGYSPLSELWWDGLLTVSRDISVQGSPDEIEELTKTASLIGGTSIPVIGSEEEQARQIGRLNLGLRMEPRLLEEEQRWYVSFWAEIQDDYGTWLPSNYIWGRKETNLEVRGRHYEAVQEQLLMALGEAASVSFEISNALTGPAPIGMELTPEQLFAFVRESVPLLTSAGVTVQLPSRWSKEKRRVGLSLKMVQPAETDSRVGIPVALGMDHLVSFEVEAALGGITLTLEEMTKLAESDVPYAEFRGEWIEVDLKEIRQVMRYIKKHEKGQMEISDWMHLTAEDSDERMWKGLTVMGMETVGMLSSLLEGSSSRKVPIRPIPESLHGVLRPYQERGYQWLSAMRDLGFGVCLADDMGLGKTVQVITCLLERMVEHTHPILIVCPTSLLGNWQRELQRFAPDLSIYIHHGNRRLHGEAFINKATEYDVILTTYHLCGRDGVDLAQVSWATIVLDEAQYIKNYRTKQAQSVMKLSSPHRIAMTGTPVENRLGELWSIFQFLNPGYLGTSSSFRHRYTGDDEQGRLQELHRLVAPFMLRRLKSDPDIAKDLPEKIELKSYCTLTDVQGAMYQAVVDQMLVQIEQETGIARKGLVLSSLTKLKQICDHPQLLGKEDSRGSKQEASGKMERLLELLDSIEEIGESALIFTQYVAMGQLLVSRLAARYGKVPSFLHGGVPKQERDEMVNTFQEQEGSAFFVLSLKAGGVGLNLTRANHVLHYDRWWNPAVENQATDRVFRIGQHKNVQVHKLICQGTLEERIDELIENKKALSEQVVGSGETWLTEMSDADLKDLIALQGEDWM
ncbi:DEAD/DEAH box helicase [Paenibacillus macquariensis]|uniref:Superfamily II DNA or RNA helicase, SNF2 family n=1 Tax=Paenibacillus macquariensis TaxID=948756 RepID=A0ABY1K954_9BACL|nr:DEAD/DEAH box helicase [Paenibacillus macquariensis]MEC0091536.1 DEAD/DEAH box helicase [Paenibacillus macquariensis]OAB26667.1 DNA helicase [Paenibacillus macquariensis subsp. macquariensis]SIR44273.1 Superfamily II DNA or RNA helicase, SNF2 family [Paenibacillus macquariensis]